MACQSPRKKRRRDVDKGGISEDDATEGHAGTEQHAWHFDMLHDNHRLAAFASAFARLPEAPTRQSPYALDIGTGSGVLGLALLRAAPALNRVVGVEGSADLCRVARANAARNSLGEHDGLKKERRHMRVIEGQSTDLSSVAELGESERAHVVTCEILDAGLLGEDCLGTLRHAARELLAPGYFAIPASAEIFGCAVESRTLASWQHLGVEDQTMDRRLWPEAFRQDAGSASPHDVNLERLLAAGDTKLLTGEFRVLNVDFEQLPPESGQHTVLDVKATASGRVDAIVFWWRCCMLRGDTDDALAMTNAPFIPTLAGKTAGAVKAFGAGDGVRGEIDHWRQAVCVLPRPAMSVRRGDTFRLFAAHDEKDVWFRTLGPSVVGPQDTAVPQASSGLALWSNLRLWQLNDLTRTRALRIAVRAAVRGLALNPWEECGGALVLDLSDGPLLGLFAHGALVSRKQRRLRSDPRSARLRRLLRLAGHKPMVQSLEASPEDHAVAQELVAWGCRLKRRSSGPSLQAVLGSPSLAPESVGIMLAEPYARACEGFPCDAQLWQHWAQVDALSWALKPGAALVPLRFRVLGALVECSALWRRRQCVSEPVCGGVDVQAINSLHAEAGIERRKGGFRPRFPSALWQSAHTVFSDAAILCDVALCDPMPEHRRRFPETSLTCKSTDGKVHAVATWTEVELSPGQWIASAEIRSGYFRPGPCSQGILLFPEPIDVASAGAGFGVVVQACFDCSDGALLLKAGSQR